MFRRSHSSRFFNTAKTMLPSEYFEHINTLGNIFLNKLHRHDFAEAQKLNLALQTGYRFRKEHLLIDPIHDTPQKPIVRIRFYPSDFPEAQQKALQTAIYQLNNLLCDTKQCSRLLKKLDEKIAVFGKKLGIAFDAFHPGEGILLHGDYLAPTAETLQQNTFDTHNILLYVIKEQLAKEEIDTQDSSYTFVGFIDELIANNFIRQGRLFTESFLSGNALLHGVYAHYLQWYLFSIAKDEGILTLPEDVSLRDIMIASVDAKVTYGQPIWSSLLDYTDTANKNFRPYDQFELGSPYRLSVFLHFSPETPHLRGYLLNEWIQNISTIQALQKEIYGQAMPYECLVNGFAVADNVFDGMDLGISMHHIHHYYQKMNHTPFSFDASTRILTEKNRDKFAFAEAHNNLDIRRPSI